MALLRRNGALPRHTCTKRTGTGRICRDFRRNLFRAITQETPEPDEAHQGNDHQGHAHRHPGVPKAKNIGGGEQPRATGRLQFTQDFLVNYCDFRCDACLERFIADLVNPLGKSFGNFKNYVMAIWGETGIETGTNDL